MSIKQTASIDVGALRAAMSTAIGAVERRNTIPILANVALMFEPGALVVRSTNLDMQVDRRVPADVKASWAITVPAHVLKAVVDKLPPDQVVLLSHADGKLTVGCGRSRINLSTLPIADFPSISTGDWDAEFEMAGGELVALIGHCKGAVSSEEARYYLNGIFVQRSEASLIFVGTDGHRLSKAERPAPNGSEPLGLDGALSEGVILPRALLPLAEMLGQEARVSVALSGNRVKLDAGESTVVSKLVDGQFPDWRRVVPAHEVVARIDPKALSEAVSRVAAVSTDKTRGVRFDLADDLATLTVVCPETGMASEEVPISYGGGLLTVGFNAAYLQALLPRFLADEIEVLVGDGREATLWRASEGASDIHVVMPMRV